MLLLLAAALFPDILYLRYHNPGKTALMVTRGGDGTQTWVPLHRISASLLQAVMVGEDLDFYRHGGIDLYELKQSIKKNWREKRWARGASTITMQLAKNLYLSTRKSPVRKILELTITLELEQLLPKARILEIYLNVIEWGDHVYGAEAAAQHHFHKSAGSLGPAEAAFLAAIIPNPRLYSHPPYRHYAERRKRWILYRMGHPERPMEEPAMPELPGEAPPNQEEAVEPEPLPPEAAEPADLEEALP